MRVESALLFTESTFDRVFASFTVVGPGDDTVTIRHHFALAAPDTRAALVRGGEEVYRRTPWAIHRTPAAHHRRRGRLHPFDPEAAALFFALVSSRYERSSIIVSLNKTFSARAEILGDPVAVAALVDRLVHQSEVLVLRGESYRLNGEGREALCDGDER